MTLFLASVRDEAEAGIALRAGADILDLKEPAYGALGAVTQATAHAIVASIAGRAPVSATIGDLPMQPMTIRTAVKERASLDVDYIKIGLFPAGDAQRCLAALRPLAKSAGIVIVLFADRLPDFDAIAAVAAMGATGIMLDTADKGAGSLLDHLALGELTRFVAEAKAHGLAVGLAGSLTQGDVPTLLALQPDLLGFRGALCRGARSASLDLNSCRAIRALIPRTPNPPLAFRPRPAFNGVSDASVSGTSVSDASASGTSASGTGASAALS